MLFTTFTCQATVCKNETASSDVIVPFGLHAWKSFTYGRRVGEHLLCRPASDQRAEWSCKACTLITDFLIVATAVHASHEVGAVNYGSCCTL